MRFNPLDFGWADFSRRLVAFEPTGHWTFGEEAFPGTVFAVGMPKTQAGQAVFPPVCISQLLGQPARMASSIAREGPCTDGLAMLLTPAAGQPARTGAAAPTGTTRKPRQSRKP